MSEDHMKHLNALRRLPENKICATCPYEERMGFKDVCMKFKIFVCGDCKSAHQSFSHRCKARGTHLPPTPSPPARPHFAGSPVRAAGPLHLAQRKACAAHPRA